MKRAGWAFGSAIMVLFTVSSCSTTKVVVAKLATPTPTSPPALLDAAPRPTRTPMPVVTPPPSRYDQIPGVIYEQKAATPTPTARPPAPRTTIPAVPPTSTPPAAAPSPATVRPTAAAPRSMATAPRPTATATRVPATAVPPTATATATATATRVPPTETAVPSTATAPARTEGSARPTPTRKPSAYYEDPNVPFRLAVTWTPTPTPPGKRR